MDDTRRERLFNAVRESYKSLERFRTLNQKLIELYAGHHYKEDDGMQQSRRYVNLVNQAVEAYTTMLVGSNPQADLTAVQPELKAFAQHFKIALNNLMDEIDLGGKLQEWIRNAFFSVGVAKVHMGDSGEIIAEGDIEMDPGKPFISVISMDDWVHDALAKKWSECKFQGDMYQMAMEDIKAGAEDGTYDKKAVSQIHSAPTVDDGERVESLGREIESSDIDFERMVDLIDIYIPRDRKIYTFYVSDKRRCILQGRPLAVLEWEGNEKGPYHQLGFTPVPTNCMPVPLAAQWADLDTIFNSLLRKNVRQSDRSKGIIGYEPASADDAKKAQMAADGELVEMRNIDGVKPMQVGGIDGALFSFAGELLKLFDRQAGNLQALLGLGASSDTVGQEKLIHGAASKLEDSMGAIVVSKTIELLTELARLLWADEFKQIPGTVQVDGFPELSADSTWMPGDREGMFSDYKIQCDVFSLRSSSPAERIQLIERAMQGILPFIQLLQQQGGSIDVAALTAKYSELMNIPGLKDIVKFDQPVGEGNLPRNDTPMKSPNSQRTYTRRNVSGDNGQTDPGAIAQAQQPQPQPTA